MAKIQTQGLGVGRTVYYHTEALPPFLYTIKVVDEITQVYFLKYEF